MIKQVNTAEFEELIKGDLPVVVDFFAVWCGPCKMLSPVMEALSQEFADKAVFVKMDTDECIDVAYEYGIRAIPQVSVFKKGEQVAKTIGFSPKGEMAEFLQQHI